jgi:hypothetical protein
LQDLEKSCQDEPFGCCFAAPNTGYNVKWEAKMSIVILMLEVLGTWSVVALVAGLGLGAAIARGERVRREEFLACVFASLETMQALRN